MTEERRGSGRFRAIVEWLATLGMLAAAVIVAWVAIDAKRTELPHPAPIAPLPKAPLAIDGAELLGSRSAPAGLVVFSDFQCPYCGLFARGTFAQIRHEYVDSGKLLVVFRNFPMDRHPQARLAAAAGMCAGQQGRFWQMHDELFADQLHLSADDLRLRAQSVGLDTRQFESCLGRAGDGAVRSDLALGESLEVQGTPTFFAGVLRDGSVAASERFSGAKQWGQLQELLEKVIDQGQKTNRKGN